METTNQLNENQVRIYNKVVSTKHGSANIKTVKVVLNNSYVEYMELESILDHLSNGNIKLKKKMKDEIDRCYYKNFRLEEGERVKRCVDVVALTKCLKYIDDYEAHKCITASASGVSPRAYGYEQLIESFRYALNKWRAHSTDVLNVNKYDRLESDFKHNKIDNRDRSEELTTKEKAELMDEFFKLRDSRRKTKNTIGLTDQYKNLFERKGITHNEFETMIQCMDKLNRAFDDCTYNQRSSEVEKECWKSQLQSKFKVR